MSSRQTRPEIKSCGVIVFREQPTLSFLLMEHSDRLDLPKGHVDDGESDLETAMRELQEETGIVSDDISLDPEFRYSQTYIVRKKRYGKEPRLKELVIFLGSLVRDVELQMDNVTEHIGFRWVDWDPPHLIQEKTIDPLLNAVDEFWSGKK